MSAKQNKLAFEILKSDNKLGYGESIDRAYFQELFNIKVLTDDEAQHLSFKEVKERLKTDDLKELNCFNFIREELLKAGMHFHRVGESYRIALPSEMDDIIASLMKGAQKKMKRAELLLLRTPSEAISNHNVIAGRLFSGRKRAEKLTKH